MITRGFGWMLVSVAGMVALSGCSEKNWSSRNQENEHTLTTFGQRTLDQRGKEEGRWASGADTGDENRFRLGGDDGIFGARGKDTSGKDDVRNNKLFAGALDVAMPLPISVASRESGFIATDWSTSPNDPNMRYRLNIRVSGRPPYGDVKVVVLKQEKVNGLWEDRPTDSQMTEQAAQIEKAIRIQSQNARP